MSTPIEAPSSSPLLKRRKPSSSVNENKSPSPVNENKASSPQQIPITALPPPMVACASPAASSSSAFVLTTTAVPHAPPPVAYYPVYTTHAGHFYIASPPLQPTPPSPQHPTKILPKLPPNHHHAPPTPVTLPTSPSSSSAPYPYYHPYQVSPSMQPIHPSVYVHPHSPQTSATITTADQREQARRQSHSAIERRRREKINDKIMQLKQLIPTCADQENLHKMSILQSAIEYITYLKEILEKTDNDDMEKNIQHQPIKLNWDLKKNNHPGIETPPSAHTSQFSTIQQQQQQQQQDQHPTTTTPSQSESESSLSPSTNEREAQIPQQCLKPMDVFMSKRNSTSLKSVTFNAKDSTPEKSDTPKNMSLKNMLC